MLPICLVSFNCIQYLERSLLLLVIATLDLPMRTIKFCCRWRNVKASCHKHFVDRYSKQRRLPAMNVTNFPPSGGAVCITLGGRTVEDARWSQISYDNRILPNPPAFDGDPRWNIAITFSTEKLEWCGCPTVKKWRYGYSFRQYTNVTDGQTDRQTLRDVARQKSSNFDEIWYATAGLETDDSCVN